MVFVLVVWYVWYVGGFYEVFGIGFVVYCVDGICGWFDEDEVCVCICVGKGVVFCEEVVVWMDCLCI